MCIVETYLIKLQLEIVGNRYGTIDFHVYINPTFPSNMFIFMPKANVVPCRYSLEN